jgi:hypothetical protein
MSFVKVCPTLNMHMKKTKKLSFRLTTEEFEGIRAYAIQQNMKPSGVLRRFVADALKLNNENRGWIAQSVHIERQRRRAV